MVKFEKTNIKDYKGKTYRTGDIVYNPSFGDVWVVGKYTKQQLEDYKPECKYYLCQYGYMDSYFMDLDEPFGFIIVHRRR